MKKLLPILILLCIATGARANIITITSDSLPYTSKADNDTIRFFGVKLTTAGDGINVVHKNILIDGQNDTLVYGTNGLGGTGIRWNNGTSGAPDGRGRCSRVIVMVGATTEASTVVSASPTMVNWQSGDYNRFDSCRFIAQGTNARAMFDNGGGTHAGTDVSMKTVFRCTFKSTSVRFSDRQSTSTSGLITYNQDPSQSMADMVQGAPYTNQHSLLISGQPATQKVYHNWFYGCNIERAHCQGYVMKGFTRVEACTVTVDAANLLNVAGNCYGLMNRNGGSNPSCQSTDSFGVIDCIFRSGTTYAGGRNLWCGFGIGTASHPFFIRGNTFTATSKPSGNFAEGIQGSGSELNIGHGIRLETEGVAGRRYAYLQVDNNTVTMMARQDATDCLGLLANMRDEDTIVTIENNIFTVGSSDGFGNQVHCFLWGYGTAVPAKYDPTMIVRNNTFNYGGSAVQCGTSAGPNVTPTYISGCTFNELPANQRVTTMPMKAGGVTPTMFGVGRIGGTAGYVDTGTIILDGIFASLAQSTDLDFVSVSEPSLDVGEIAVTCSVLVLNAANNPVPNARVHMKNAQGNYVIGSATASILSNADGYAIQPVVYYRKQRQSSTTTTFDRNPFTVFAAENVTGGDTSVGATAVTLAYNKKRDTVVLPNTGTGAFYNGLTIVVDSIANDYSSQLDSIRIRVTTDSRAWPDSFTVSYGTAATYPAYNASTQHFVQAWTASNTFNLWITGFSMYESDTLLLTSRVYDFDSLSPIAQTNRAFMEPPICTYSISADTIDFGTVDSGAVRDIAVQLTNSGGEQIVGTPVVAGSSKFTIQNGGGVYNLTETQSRTVTLRFAPNAPTATDYATFTFGSGTCVKTYILKGKATTVAPPPPPSTSAFKIRIKKT